MHQISSASDLLALQAAETLVQPDEAFFNSRELVARVLLRVATFSDKPAVSHTTG